MQDPEVQPDAQPVPATVALPAKPRSLSKPFNRAGAPSIADLGFDAQQGELADDDTGQQASASQNDMIGFPGERVPHISFGFEGERWRIRNVAWVIGQSETGQQILDYTNRAGYRIGFDSMTSTGEKLECYTNLTDKVITLDGRANTEQLVVMLTYSLGLAAGGIDGLFFDSSMHPPAALLANRMAGAYALALQLQVCHELRTAKTLPESSDREVYWRQVAKEHSRLSSAFAQTAINDMAISQGAAMAAAIREFYDHKGLRERYDIEVVNYYRALPAGLLKDPKAMIAGFDPGAQAFKLKFPGLTYALNHEPKLDLKAPVNIAASAAIAEAVAALQVARRNAGVKDREPWHVQTV